MVKTIKATYDFPETVDNVVFDLIGTGIPQDNISTDKTKNQVEVEIPGESEPEIRQLLARHNPEKLT